MRGIANGGPDTLATNQSFDTYLPKQLLNREARYRDPFALQLALGVTGSIGAESRRKDPPDLAALFSVTLHDPGWLSGSA